MFLLEPTFLWRVITISGCEKTQGFGAGQWQDCGHSNRGVAFLEHSDLELLTIRRHQDNPKKVVSILLGGGSSNIYYFHPENWGRFPF